MIRACTFCHSFVGQMEKGDLKTNTKSIKELMKRLALTPASLYSALNTSTPQSQPNNQNANDPEQNNLFRSFLDSMQALSLDYDGAIATASTSSLTSNPNSSNGISSLNNSSTSSLTGLANTSVNSSSQQSTNQNLSNASNSPSNATVNSGATNDDTNNPFDVTENKDYFKSQDVEIKQLIINVFKFLIFT